MREGGFDLGTGGLRIDVLRRRVSWLDRPVRLCAREFDFLVHLFLSRPALVSRRELLREICLIDFDPGTNIVEVHISRIRAKLAEAGADGLIETVRGQGYRLVG